MTRILILGGGFGGLATAHRLTKETIPDLEIILFDQQETFAVGFRKTWTLLGSDPDEGTGRLSNLEKKGIRRITGKITSIDPMRKTVEINQEKLDGDYIVVALGAELAPESIPGSAGCSVIEDRLANAGITFLANHSARAVEEGHVLFTNGVRLPFDLLLGVALHHAPEIVRRGGLTDGGDWIPVDSETLETRFPGVYAIGDVNQVKMANGKPLTKAGVFAEGEGLVVAERILATLAGKKPSAVFEGKGGCFLEVGGKLAVKIEGHFLAHPEPVVSLSEASPVYLEEKLQFEKERLTDWLD